MDAEAPPAGKPKFSDASGYRYVVLGMLFLLYALNYLDRQIIGILAIPIQKDLQLTDTELGLMGGIAFALLYSILGVPVARLADKHSRVRILTGALVLWSAFTALCGVASNFWTLFLARLGVGVGEAGGTAPSYSLISDIFPPEQRGRALSIFFLGSQLGGSLGIFMGGHLAAELGWRATFIIVGSIGLIVAPIFLLVVREPKRGLYDPAPVAGAAAPSFREVLGFVAKTPATWFVGIGSATAAMLNYGVAFWLPALMQRSFGFTLAETSNFLALSFLIGGSTGLIFAGVVGDWAAKRDKGGHSFVGALSIVAALACILAAVLAPTTALALTFVVGLIVTDGIWGPVATTVVQNLAPPAMRTTISAFYLLIVNLFGLGLGTLILGAVSDALAAQFQEQAMRYSLLAVSLILCPISATCLAVTGFILRRPS